MVKLKIHKDPRVAEKIATYPMEVRLRMHHLRKLIIETAAGFEDIEELEETQKWGEPSYLVKNGSTIRIDWKPKSPNQYAMYFKCTSKLVPEFKSRFEDLFRYEKTRALLFDLNEELPEKEVKECVAMALRYHILKEQLA